MADLIDRDALLKDMGLTDAVKYGNKDAEQQYHSYSTMMLYEIADAIWDAPAVNCWISVHDVLPMEGMDVLVCNFDEWCGIASYHGDYWEDDQGRCVPAYAISHWRELPALPKKEG